MNANHQCDHSRWFYDTFDILNFHWFSHLCIQRDFADFQAAVNESVRLCFRHGSETAAPPPPPPDSCHRHHPRREPQHWRSSVFGGGGGGGGAKCECSRVSGSPQRLSWLTSSASLSAYGATKTPHSIPFPLERQLAGVCLALQTKWKKEIKAVLM